ncbi:MAG: hypothetical protein QMD46_12770 [Methanomicrobiales archaeon]|nr:hypothetical protein [Methanomicrobiales archaeon]
MQYRSVPEFIERVCIPFQYCCYNGECLFSGEGRCTHPQNPVNAPKEQAVVKGLVKVV